MARPIDADKVEKWSWQEPRYSDSINDRTDLREFLRSLPTLSSDDVRGVGKWLPHPDERVIETEICSACGIGTKKMYHCTDGMQIWVEEPSFQYCPYCGAKMKGAEENHTMDEFMYGQEMGSHSDGSL